MKRILAVLLSVLMLAAFCVPAMALGEEMTVKKGTIVVDGKIDEAWAQAERQELTHIKNNVAKPDDSSCFVSVLWNDNTLYFLFEITDDDPSFASTAGDWKNDGIQLYIDELAMAGKTYAEGQYQFALIPKDGMSMTPRKGDAAAAGAFEFEYAETDDGYVIECAYTCNMATLAAGYELYADFQYNDCNGAAERTHNFGWSDETDAAVNDATVWGTLKLSAEAVKVAATTTAAPATTTAAPAAPAAPEVPAAPATADAAVILAAIVMAAGCGIVVAKKKH